MASLSESNIGPEPVALPASPSHIPVPGITTTDSASTKSPAKTKISSRLKSSLLRRSTHERDDKSSKARKKEGLTDSLDTQNEKQVDLAVETGKHVTAAATKVLAEPGVDDSERVAGAAKPGELKKVQRLNKDLTKQNSQLLKFVETLKKEKDNLLADKQKLRTDNRVQEKELRKSSSALDTAHGEISRLKHQLVKRGSSTSSLGSVRMEVAPTLLQLEEKIGELEAQLSERDGDMEPVQRKNGIQLQQFERKGSWDGEGLQLQLDEGDFHSKSSTRPGVEGCEHARENGGVSEAHVPMDTLLEEQEVSSKLQQENSELLSRISSLQAELEQQRQKSTEVPQEGPRSRRISPGGFFKRGRRHTYESRGPTASKEHDDRRSKSPDILTASDSAHDLYSPKSPHHRGAYRHRSSSTGTQPIHSTSPSPRRTYSGTSIQEDVSALQARLRAALEEKQTFEVQKVSLEKELKDTRSQIEEMQQSVLSESQKVTKELEELKQTLEVALKEKSRFSEQVHGLTIDVQTHQRQNEELKRTIDEMSEKMRAMEGQQVAARLKMSQEQERVKQEAEQEMCKLRNELEEQTELTRMELETKYQGQVRELEAQRDTLKKDLEKAKSTQSTRAAATPSLANIGKSVSVKAVVRRFSSSSFDDDESSKPPHKSAMSHRMTPTSPKHSTSYPIARKLSDKTAPSFPPAVTSPKHSPSYPIARKLSDKTAPSFPPAVTSPKHSPSYPIARKLSDKTAPSIPPAVTSPKHSPSYPIDRKLSDKTAQSFPPAVTSPKHVSFSTNHNERATESAPPPSMSPKHSPTVAPVKEPSTGGVKDEATAQRNTRTDSAHSKVTRTVSCGTGIRHARARVGTSKVSAARALFEGKIESEKTHPVSPKRRTSQTEDEETEKKSSFTFDQTGTTQPTGSTSEGRPSANTVSHSKSKTIDVLSSSSQKNPPSSNATSMTNGVSVHSSSSPSQTVSAVRAPASTPTSNGPSTPGSGPKVSFTVRSRSSTSPSAQPNASKEEVRSGMGQSRVVMNMGTSAATPSVPASSNTTKVVQTTTQSRTVHRVLSLGSSNGHPNSNQQARPPTAQPTSPSSSLPSPRNHQQGKVHKPLTKSLSYNPQYTYSHASPSLKVANGHKSIPTITTEAAVSATPTSATPTIAMPNGATPISTTSTNATPRVVTFRQSTPGTLTVASKADIRHASSLQDIPEQVADSNEDASTGSFSQTNSPVALRMRRRARADRPMSLNRAETVNLANMISRLQGQGKGGGSGMDQGKTQVGVPAGKGVGSGAPGEWRRERPASYYGGDASKLEHAANPQPQLYPLTSAHFSASTSCIPSPSSNSGPPAVKQTYVPQIVKPSERKLVRRNTIAGFDRHSKKALLLRWCQIVTDEYDNIAIENFGSSFSDGLAFCAILHHFIPDKIPYNSLTPTSREKNFRLAFEAAETEDIPSLLDVEDMVALPIPDWMSVMTYVSFIYNKFGRKDVQHAP